MGPSNPAPFRPPAHCPSPPVLRPPLSSRRLPASPSRSRSDCPPMDTSRVTMKTKMAAHPRRPRRLPTRATTPPASTLLPDATGPLPSLQATSASGHAGHSCVAGVGLLWQPPPWRLRVASPVACCSSRRASLGARCGYCRVSPTVLFLLLDLLLLFTDLLTEICSRARVEPVDGDERWAVARGQATV